ncbi:MAG: TetR family transcriptional regulator [Pseudonocardiales bacterium]|nr:TetR family transcriptional regulator [Pseudonocardiales bacterium]
MVEEKEKVARTLRKDAARNRALLLEAARDVFAERGLDASLDDIAHRAGLGVGTAYRHFAKKQEIAEALFASVLDQVLAEIEHALTVDDPWEALVTFFEAAAASQAKDRGLHQVLVGTYTIEDMSPIRERLTASLVILFDRAKAAGVLRKDVEVTDVGAIFTMLGPVYDMSVAISSPVWRRYLALLLDGLRAVDQPPLPWPSLTEAEFNAAIATIKGLPVVQKASTASPAR